MPLDLTDLDRTVLPRSPLASVICQVRYDITPKASEPQTARTLLDRLTALHFDRLDQILESSLNVSVTPGSAPAVAQQAGNKGWRLASPDGTRSVVLLPTHVAVEATSYGGWEQDFAPVLSEVLASVGEVVEPAFEQRIGLRYINQITAPEIESAPEWRDWVDPSFLGLAVHPELGDMVAFNRNVTTLELDEDARSVVNSGFAPDPDRDGRLTFLLDIDVAREGMRPFDVNGIRETANLFNSYALRLFQLATTPALREVLADG